MRYCVLLILVLFSCVQKKEPITKQSSPLSKEDSVKYNSYFEKAFKYGLHSQERQLYLDSTLIIKPDDAYLWQQKSMPLYKARKYDLGKPFLAKAVFYNPERYLDYSAFMKCIFSKEYEESINEFKDYKIRFGDSYVMDHTYNFYIALNYLQLNQFEKAKTFLLKSKVQQFSDFPNDSPEEGCHFLDWYYLGVVEYELGNYKEAIENLDMSLIVYTNFADALSFKGKCYLKLGNKEKATELFKEAYKNKRNTFNEDNVFYEIYPYQVFHKLRINN